MKDNVKRMKRQDRLAGNIYKRHLIKYHYPKYKNNLKLNSKITTQFLKRAKNLRNKHFTKEDTQMENKHMKR